MGFVNSTQINKSRFKGKKIFYLIICLCTQLIYEMDNIWGLDPRP